MPTTSLLGHKPAEQPGVGLVCSTCGEVLTMTRQEMLDDVVVCRELQESTKSERMYTFASDREHRLRRELGALAPDEEEYLRSRMPQG